MKLRHEQLTQHLKNTLAPIYLLTGDEIFFRNQCLDQLRQHTKTLGFNQRESQEVTTQFDWQQWLSQAHNLSLFSNKTLVELHCPQIKFGKAGGAILKQYSANPNHDKVLIIVGPKLDSHHSKSAWYKAIEKVGVHIALWPLDHNQLHTWLTQRLRHYHLTLTTGAQQLLLQYNEGNLFAFDQTLQLLTLWQQDKPLTEKEIDLLLQNNNRFDVFALTEAALSGDYQRVAIILDTLKSTNTAPVLVLWALQQDINLLTQLAQGHPQQFAERCQQAKVWPKRRPLLKKALSRLTQEDCWQLLTFCAEIDLACKGLATLDPWLALNQLAMRLTAPQKVNINSVVAS